MAGKTPVRQTISWHANAALESCWNCTQNMSILAWLACGILIFGESARAYIWQKGQNARLAGKKTCAPADSLKSNCGIGKPLKFYMNNITPVAGLIFETKKSSDFSGEIFRERNYWPRTGFSGSNPCSILSHPVMSWYGSRVVGCLIGREITAKTCSLLGNDSNEGTPPDFERFFLEKRPWKRFSTNVLIRGKWIHSTANSGNKIVRAVMLLQKFLSRKISPEKSLDFWSQKSVLRPA